MSATEAKQHEVIAAKVYKELGMQLADFKAKAAEIDISVKGAVHRLSSEETQRILAHLDLSIPEQNRVLVSLGLPAIPEPVAVKLTPAERAAAEEAARVQKERDDEAARVRAEEEHKRKVEETARLERERLVAEEEARRQAAEEARRKAEEDAQKATLDGIARKLNVRPDQVDPIARTLGVTFTTADAIEPAIALRVQAFESPLKLADELTVDLKQLADLGRKIGIDISKRTFQGLNPSETVLLRAIYKQQYKTVQERKAEVTVHEPEYTPAAPTGNKAVTEVKKKETGKVERTGAPRPGTPKTGSDEDEWGRKPGPQQKGPAAGRSGRKRFDITEISYDRPRAGGGKRRGGRRDGDGDDAQAPRAPEVPTGPVSVEVPINLRQLSEAMGIKTNEIMARMLAEGLPAFRINETLSKDVIEQIGIIFDREITVREPKDAEVLIQEQLDVFAEEAGEPETRAPIVTIMGHVDHGKTSLLDAIASMERVSGESGGITQHIGAFRIELERQGDNFRPISISDGLARRRNREETLKSGNGKGADRSRKSNEPTKLIQVTFIDTPGHEAFTAMRARGANVTDIAVIVVSADDGVMPQTEEAIAHARAAQVEIVVAITKIDKDNANVSRVRQQLARLNLMSPEWGGNTEIIELSSVTKEGIDKLLSTLSDMSELLELKAVEHKPAVGTVMEAHRDMGRGIVATVIVQEGTLKRGDVIVAGHGYGRVRSLQVSRGDGLHVMSSAGPGMPIEVAGLDELPEAGARFHGLKDIKKAAEIANMVAQQEKELARSRGFSLEDWSKAKAGQSVKELILVLKCDVQGSVETIRAELEKLQHAEVRVKLIHSAVGQISTNDVHLAEAAGGIVVGFHVSVDPVARELSDNHHVDIRTYEIIYRLIDDIRNALSGLLAPELIETYQGTAEIRKVFKLSKVGAVAGCYVIKGLIKRDSKVRLQRQGVNVWQGQLSSLKRVKDDAAEVREGMECGMQLAGYDDIKEGDHVEAFTIEERKRSL